MPTRDVDVTYDVAVNGNTIAERMRWNVRANLLRVDPPSQGLYMITDYNAHRVTIVRERDRSFAQSPAPAATLAGPAGTPRARTGTDTVASLACTEWATVDTEQHPVVACVTDDGVVLRVRAAGKTLLAARSVTYAAQDPALFAVPSGYHPLEGAAHP